MQSKIYRPSNNKTIHTCLPFTIDSKLTGYAPPNAQLKDTICQFPNSETAVVLREQQDGRYEIIGRAFVENANTSSSGLEPLVGGFWREMGLEVDVVALQQLTAATDPVLIMPGRPLTSRQW